MKSRILIASSLFCVAALSFTTVADEPKKAAPGAPAKAADGKPAGDMKMTPEMEACMKAGMPGDHHKHLEATIGKWTTKNSFWMAPGTDPMVSNGTAERKWILDGRFIQEDFKSDMDGQPFTGMALNGYDNSAKHYVSTWADSMSTGMMYSTGTCTDGKNYTYKGEMADPMKGGAKAAYTMKVAVEKDKMTMEMFSPGPDGKDFRCMEIVYTRAAASAAK